MLLAVLIAVAPGWSRASEFTVSVQDGQVALHVPYTKESYVSLCEGPLATALKQAKVEGLRFDLKGEPRQLLGCLPSEKLAFRPYFDTRAAAAVGTLAKDRHGHFLRLPDRRAMRISSSSGTLGPLVGTTIAVLADPPGRLPNVVTNSKLERGVYKVTQVWPWPPVELTPFLEP